MTKPLLLLAIFLLSFTGQQQNFNTLFQLTGRTWQMKTAKGFICEKWEKVNDNELSGIGFSVNGTDTTIDEHMQLIKKEGDIFFVAIVTDQNGGKQVPFKLISTANNTYIFSNPEHDYPQQVAYHLKGPDLLDAWIDGNAKGKQKRFNFHYTRAKD